MESLLKMALHNNSVCVGIVRYGRPRLVTVQRECTPPEECRVARRPPPYIPLSIHTHTRVYMPFLLLVSSFFSPLRLLFLPPLSRRQQYEGDRWADARLLVPFEALRSELSCPGAVDLVVWNNCQIFRTQLCTDMLECMYYTYTLAVTKILYLSHSNSDNKSAWEL